MKRRKVNKKEFFDQNPSLFFGNFTYLLQKIHLLIDNKFMVKYKNQKKINRKSKKKNDFNLIPYFLIFIYEKTLNKIKINKISFITLNFNVSYILLLRKP